MTNAEAGWYPQDDGRLRYWDGSIWTEHFHQPEPVSAAAPKSVVRSAIEDATQRVVAKAPLTGEDTVWEAVGRPMTGIGGGRYRVTPHYIFFERGTLRTDSQQAPVSAVLDVDVRQTMSQKARGVFTLVVHVQRAHGVEMVRIEDISNGREAQRIINETAHRARLAIQEVGNTRTYRHEGNAAAPIAMVASAASAGASPIEQVRQLTEMQAAGFLTDEEFASKKAEILARM